MIGLAVAIAISNATTRQHIAQMLDESDAEIRAKTSAALTDVVDLDGDQARVLDWLQRYFSDATARPLILISDLLKKPADPIDGFLTRECQKRFAGHALGTIAILQSRERLTDIDRTIVPDVTRDDLAHALVMLLGRLQYLRAPVPRQAVDPRSIVIRPLRSDNEAEFRSYFQLRHRVYSQMGYLDDVTERSLSKLEMNEADVHSIHLGAYCRSGYRESLVGSARVVTNSEADPVLVGLFETIADRDPVSKQRLGEAYQLGLPIFHTYRKMTPIIGEIFRKGQKCGELSHVIVDQAFRGSGISNRLISEALERAAGRGVARIFLECLKIHEPLYEKHGFRRMSGFEASVIDVNRTMIAMELQEEVMLRAIALTPQARNSLPMSLGDSSPRIDSIFVSSTCKDMELYRREVANAVSTKAEMACFLSEDWPGGFDDTAQKCRDRVLAAKGFFLLLGYYYGWVPSDGKSITHIEFECAFERWKGLPYPPMAVFAPRHDSDADRCLRIEAEKLISQDPKERALHATRLEAFRSQVLGRGRTAQFYRDQGELRENAIVACLQWKGRTVLAAASDAYVAPGPGTCKVGTGGDSLPDYELGSLGRQDQLDAIKRVLARFNAEPDQSAVVLLVHGDEDAGHRTFLQCLARSPLLASSRPSKPGHPPMDQYDLSVLVLWIASALGVEAGSGLVEVSQLADSIGLELRRQPLYFILDRVEGLAGGLSAFATDFWCPLRDRLAELHRRAPFPHRLVAIVASYQPSEPELASTQVRMCDAADATVDFSRLIRLPYLKDFDQEDVLLWLDSMSIKDEPPGRRKQLASSVLRNAAGDADPKPLRVHERLRGANLFCD